MMPNIQNSQPEQVILEPLIKLDQVSLTLPTKKSLIGRHKITVLTGINMELLPGETLGVIGSNGAGKSSLLKLLSKVYVPDSGNIQIKEGITISLLTLQACIDKNLAGKDNALILLMMLGKRKREAESYLERIEAFSELGYHFHDPVSTYSSGMRTRLCFSAAYCLNPDIILIDEILGVGDRDFREKSNLAIKEKIQGDASVVLVSHNLAVVKSLCDRVVWLDNGQIRDQGLPSQVIDHYVQQSQR